MIQIATKSQIKEKLEQFNSIDLDDDDVVDKYFAELKSYRECVIIPDV